MRSSSRRAWRLVEKGAAAAAQEELSYLLPAYAFAPPLKRCLSSDAEGQLPYETADKVVHVWAWDFIKLVLSFELVGMEVIEPTHLSS
jgi:hypothetical protein